MKSPGTNTHGRISHAVATLSVLVLLLGVSALAQDTPATFSYQGRLSEGGLPANGLYEMEFKLYDALTEGTAQPQPSPVTIAFTTASGNAVQVNNGVFTVPLNFGVDAFPDGARFLEIGVRHPGEISFMPLTPRQQVTATPYAIRSTSAARADNATELKNQLSGAGQLNSPDNPVDWTQLKNVPASTGSTYSAGPGISISGQTIANAGVLAVGANGPLSSSGGQSPTITLSGVVPVANGGTGSTTKNFVDLSTNQMVGGTKTFSSAIVAPGITLSGRAQLTPYDPALVATLRWDLLPLGYGDFPTGKSPGSIAFDGANIWVANELDNTVTKLRANDGTQLGTFPVGSSPIAVTFDGNSIWVANFGSNNVTRLRASDGTNLGTFGAGLSPARLACDGANIWVVNQERDHELIELRAADGVRIGATRQPGANAVAFDGANIWVTGIDNPRTGFVTKLLPHGAAIDVVMDRAPTEVVFDGANIWALTPGNSSITKIRAVDGVKLGTFAVGGAVNGLAFDGANIWITNAHANNVTKLRASDGVNLGTVLVGKNPIGVAFDGVNIWVANTLSNTVSKR